MVVLSFVKYGNIHNAINFTFSIPCDAYLHIFYGLLHTFSSGPLRFCQQKHFSSFFKQTHVTPILKKSSLDKEVFKNYRPVSNLNFYCVNTTYLVDRCICPALCRSRQTLEKNVLSWALAGTGSVLFTCQVAVQPTCWYTAHACACALPLFVWRVRI